MYYFVCAIDKWKRNGILQMSIAWNAANHCDKQMRALDTILCFFVIYCYLNSILVRIHFVLFIDGVTVKFPNSLLFGNSFRRRCLRDRSL